MAAVRIVTVPHPDEMDDETFCMHMSKRHPKSLGGLSEIWPVAEGTTDAWRAFHDRLHRLYPSNLFPVSHEHLEE